MVFLLSGIIIIIVIIIIALIFAVACFFARKRGRVSEILNMPKQVWFRRPEIEEIGLLLILQQFSIVNSPKGN